MNKLNTKGFTIVEMLVSVSIFIVIAFAVSLFNRDIFYLSSNIQNNLNTQFDARRILRVVVKELRSSSPSSLGAYPISQAGTSSIIFYSNVDTDLYKERLRYFLQGTDLKRGVLKPSGSPLTYNPAQEQVTTVIRNIIATSTAIFDYFPETYAGTTTPMSLPIDLLSVRLVRVTVFIDPDINREPGPTKATSQVMLRNLKGNF